MWFNKHVHIFTLLKRRRACSWNSWGLPVRANSTAKVAATAAKMVLTLKRTIVFSFFSKALIFLPSAEKKWHQQIQKRSLFDNTRYLCATKGFVEEENGRFTETSVPSSFWCQRFFISWKDLSPLQVLPLFVSRDWVDWCYRLVASWRRMRFSPSLLCGESFLIFSLHSPEIVRRIAQVCCSLTN